MTQMKDDLLRQERKLCRVAMFFLTFNIIIPTPYAPEVRSSDFATQFIGQ